MLGWWVSILLGMLVGSLVRGLKLVSWLVGVGRFVGSVELMSSIRVFLFSVCWCCVCVSVMWVVCRVDLVVCRLILFVMLFLKCWWISDSDCLWLVRVLWVIFSRVLLVCSVILVVVIVVISVMCMVCWLVLVLSSWVWVVVFRLCRWLNRFSL